MSTVGLARDDELPTPEFFELLIGEDGLDELGGEQWESMAALVKKLAQ